MISVIVPVYNTAPYLKQCVDSLLNQTHIDIESKMAGKSTFVVNKIASKFPKT